MKKSQAGRKGDGDCGEAYERWFRSEACPVRPIIKRLCTAGALRACDAEHLVQYLFHKLGLHRRWKQVKSWDLGAFTKEEIVWLGRLLAAMVYLELFYAQAEPLEKRFVRNFLLMREGADREELLKLRQTMADFDPCLMFGQAGAKLKGLLSFEILDEDEGGAGRDSIAVHEASMQKLASHQPYADLHDLVILASDKACVMDEIGRSLVCQQEEDVLMVLFRKVPRLLFITSHPLILVDGWLEVGEPPDESTVCGIEVDCL